MRLTLHNFADGLGRGVGQIFDIGNSVCVCPN